MAKEPGLVASVREGNRWLHNPPSGEEFAAWFRDSRCLHDGMDPAEYVNGITLIPNKEKLKVTRQDAQGNPAIVEIERLVFNGYPQVDTRVRYFWNWCAVNGYLGAIEPVLPKEQTPGLPPGVYLTKIRGLDGKDYTFLNATFQVRVYEPDVRTGGKGRLVMEPPPADKTVSLHGRFGPDVTAAMRARTGAIGRALGFAGMLIVPGAGVSSAEDMIDFLGGTSEPTVPSLPGAAPTDTPVDAAPRTSGGVEELRVVVGGLAENLRDLHPDVWVNVQAWATERDLDLTDPPPAALRTLERQLRRKFEEAERAPR